MSKILIVDDEQDILEALQSYLEAANYQVTTINGAAKAIDVLAAEQFDVMITDINMPDMDGIELLKKVKEEHPLLQVIMITAFSTGEKVFESLRFGAADYLLKPLTDMEEAVTVIEAAISRTKRWRRIFMSTLRGDRG